MSKVKTCGDCYAEHTEPGDLCSECKPEEKKTRKPRSERWEPNISPDEEWISVPSPYKAYKDGV